MEEENRIVTPEEDITVEDVEIEFPEYFFTRLIGSTPIYCNYDNGFSGIKTLDEIYKDTQEDTNLKVSVYSASHARTEIEFSDLILLEPTKLNKSYTITFSNGFVLECDRESIFLMCNGVWAPINKLEVGDALFSIVFKSEALENNTKALTLTYIEIKNIKVNNYTTSKIKWDKAPKFYGMLLSKYNILLGHSLNDKDISFIVAQQ